MFGKSKNVTKLDLIDDNFSPELLAYMGEWLTYSFIRTQLHNHNAGRDEGNQLNFKDLFEAKDLRSEGPGLGYSFKYGPKNDERFFWAEPFLEFHGIVSKGITPKHSQSNMPYEQVWEKFLMAPKSIKEPIFVGFAQIANQILPNTENKVFSIAEGCQPLVNAFCTEGYMMPVAEGYVWTNKIRPKMEDLGLWEKGKRTHLKEYSKPSVKLKKIAFLNKAYLKAYQKSFDKTSIQPLIKFIKSNPFELRFAGPARESVVPIISIQMLFMQASQFWRESIKAGHQPENRMYLNKNNPFEPCQTAIDFLSKIKFEKVIPCFEPNYNRRPAPESTCTLSWSGE